MRGRYLCLESFVFCYYDHMITSSSRIYKKRVSSVPHFIHFKTEKLNKLYLTSRFYLLRFWLGHGKDVPSLSRCPDQVRCTARVSIVLFAKVFHTNKRR